MKTYNNLWSEFLSDENIKLAIKEASKHSRKNKYRRTLLKAMRENPDAYVEAVRKRASNFYNTKHQPILIEDGMTHKIRTIIVPDIMEQVVHHMVIQVLKPMLTKGMYAHSYASVPGRGSHQAKKVIEKWIRKDGKNVKYCLKMDIRKFFDTIDHSVLIEKFERKIKDSRLMRVIRVLISATEYGIPLGFYTSQWFANWLLQDLDHYIKEVLGAKYYVRFMDDMVIFGPNKKKLHKIRQAIGEYLGKMNLTLKRNWQVFRFDYIKNEVHHGRDLDFMGFRFYRDRTTLRKSIMLKCTRKARKMAKKEKITLHDIRQFLSYLGWINATNTYQMFQEWIKPIITVRSLRKRISNYDLRRKKKSCGEKANLPSNLSSLTHPILSPAT